MIKVSEEVLDQVEGQYPGIKESIYRFEAAVLPACTHCGSEDTANVQCGVIGRTIHIAYCTSKFKLIPNGPKPGPYYCNACEKCFGEAPPCGAIPASPGKNLDAADMLKMLQTHGGFTLKVANPAPEAELKSIINPP